MAFKSKIIATHIYVASYSPFTIYENVPQNYNKLNAKHERKDRAEKREGECISEAYSKW